MPESLGMNGQIDWQAQQTQHLICSLAGQRCLEPWGVLWTWTCQSTTAFITWRKEEWRKEAANIPPSEVRNDLCSTWQTLALSWGQPRGDLWEMGQSMYGPFQALQCHLEQKLKLTLLLTEVSNAASVIAPHQNVFRLDVTVSYGWFSC